MGVSKYKDVSAPQWDTVNFRVSAVSEISSPPSAATRDTLLIDVVSYTRSSEIIQISLTCETVTGVMTSK